MFERLAPQKVRNNEHGFIVQSAGRHHEEYVSDGLNGRIEVDRGPEDTAVYSGTLELYSAAGEPFAATPELRDLIVGRIVEGLEAMGTTCVVLDKS